MLAEIFMLRLEAAARVVKFEAATPSRFVPGCRLRRRPNPSGGLTPNSAAGQSRPGHSRVGTSRVPAIRRALVAPAAHRIRRTVRFL